MSKYHSMTGWRLGWLLLPRGAAASGRAAAEQPRDLRAGGVAGGGAGGVRPGGRRRNWTRTWPATPATANCSCVGCRSSGITTFAPPDGAFYAWCDIGHLTADSQAWCAEVLAATGVALAPGIDFDLVGGGRMMRLSFCGSTEELDEAVDRLAAYLA